MGEGTSFLVSLPPARQFVSSGRVFWNAAMFIAIAGIGGAVVGSAIAGELGAKALQAIFAVAVLAVAVRMLAERQKPRGDSPPRTVAPALSGVGFAVGLVASLTGTGGDAFLAPTLYNTMRFPLKNATGTSGAAITVIALAASAGYVVKGWGNVFLPGNTLGYVDFIHAIPLIIGTVAASTAGEAVARTTNTAKFKKAFAALLIVIAALMLLL